MSQVLVPIATGFEEIEAITIIDVLRRGGINVIMGSLTENLLVRGAHGIVIQTDRSIAGLSADKLDMIVLPGGWDATKTLASDKAVNHILREMNIQGKEIGAICAAPYALSVAGVLKDGYTCYPGIEDEISAEGYDSKQMVVESANIITSRGPATSIYFALAIVKKLAGYDTYAKVQSDLLSNEC
ncbi:DJ-1 family glyoxalase III [Sulfurimonas sp.]|uniref:DJ-1 family glyoxalase III n=1 Tax=Sulfurimonas sp. TaxID=2022749 RepID=UPI002600A463|nr:DJ-1 family glyoxalase III [Sulfurimonas sp.]MDD5157171.1 DJ-1/PfpI family protein [Sulfurimonas sp.]